MLMYTKTKEGLEKVKQILIPTTEKEEKQKQETTEDKKEPEAEDEHKPIMRSAVENGDEISTKERHKIVKEKLHYCMATIAEKVGKRLTDDDKKYILEKVFHIKDWRTLRVDEVDDMVNTVDDNMIIRAIVSLVKDRK